MKFFASKRVIPQVRAILFVNSASVVCGMMPAWIIPMIPRLTDPSVPDHLTLDQVGWAVSVMYLGALVGPFISGYLVDRIGRRRMILLGILPVSIFYVITGLIRVSYVGLCIAKVFAGMTTSAFASVLPMYIGEIVENDICGAMASLLPMFIHIGVLYSVTLGPFLSMNIFAYASMAVVAVMIFCISQLPESPYQLCMVGKDKEALKSLVWLRGSLDVADELSRIQKYTEERKNRKTGLLKFLQVGNRRSLLVVLFMSLTTAFSGSYFVQTYGTLIFEEAGFVVSGNVSLIILESVLIPPNIISAYCIEKFGRRISLAVSIYSIGSLLLLSAIYYNLKSDGFDVSVAAWLPLAALVSSCIFTTAGLMGIQMATIAEAFPINFKAAASTLAVLILSVLNLVNLKVFQVVEEQYGMHVVFYIYAAGMFTFGTCFFVMLPETKGQSLEEIERNFEKKEHVLFAE